MSRPTSVARLSILLAFALAACAPAAPPPNPTAAPAPPTSAPAKPAPPQPTAAPAKAAEQKPASKPAATSAPAAKPAPTSAPAKSTAKPEEVKVPRPSGNLGFTLAYPAILNFTHLPTVITIERLNGEGWKVEQVNFAQVETTTEAVAKNEVQIGLGASNSAMRATQKGLRLPLIVEYTGNEWVVVSRTQFKSCAELNGKRLAYHSEGAVSTAMVKNWVTTACNGKPEYLVISGGQNRALAMMNDQIDATPLQLGEWINLNTQQPGKFHILVNFSEGLVDLASTTYYANPSWLDQNKEVATAFLAELLKTHRMVIANPRLLETAAKKHLPQMDERALPEVVKTYAELGMFAPNGGLTAKKVEGTIKFFTETGDLEPGLTVDQASDLRFLDDALKIVGKVPGKP